MSVLPADSLPSASRTGGSATGPPLGSPHRPCRNSRSGPFRGQTGRGSSSGSLAVPKNLQYSSLQYVSNELFVANCCKSLPERVRGRGRPAPRWRHSYSEKC